MDKDHKMVKKIIDNTKKVSNYVVEKTKKAIDTTIYNISYLSKTKSFYIIDGKNGNKLETINAIFEKDYFYLNENEYDKSQNNLLKGNVLMTKDSLEMYEILKANDGQSYTYTIKKGKRKYEVLCKKIEIKRITKIT